jgi:hypothetical protein
MEVTMWTEIDIDILLISNSSKPMNKNISFISAPCPTRYTTNT